MYKDRTIKDSIPKGWVERMPENIRPYLRLSRYDRPIGFWLLGLPGWIGFAFAALSHGFEKTDLLYAALIALGAIAMRGAGCTYNDILDRDLDAGVERTAKRPLPAGTVTLIQAQIWLVLQCLAGLAVLLFLPRPAQVVALVSLIPVALYPLMKRVTFWPQAWLGLTFNWAALVAYYAKAGYGSPALIFLYLGLICWTVGYDTVYACQDRESDAIIGVKSTARLFGGNTSFWVGFFYFVCVVFIGFAATLENSHNDSALAVLFFAGHLLWQVRALKPDNETLCLFIFKSNRTAAFLLMMGLFLANML